MCSSSVLLVAHLTEDEHPPELASSPIGGELLLNFLCGTESSDGNRESNRAGSKCGDLIEGRFSGLQENQAEGEMIRFLQTSC